jgi:flagellar hook-associated protein 3 FlgL
MRVTENTLTRNYLTNINNSRGRMSKLQDQLSSGKRVQNASDDPEAADRILRTKTTIARLEQYQTNVADGQATLISTGHALDRFTDLMTDAKDILSKARSGSRTPNLETYADQIDQLITDAVQIANTKFNGKYVFGGTQTTDPPFILAADRSSVTLNPNGITGRIETMVNDGTLQQVNLDGQEALQGITMFQTLIEVRDAMRSGQVPTVAQFDTINAHLEHVAAQGGKIGLFINALEMDESFLQDRTDQLASLLSVDQDTDFAEATMALKKEELALEAAMNVAGRVIPKTLMDFIR